jgi:ATP-dependent Zn protease
MKDAVGRGTCLASTSPVSRSLPDPEPSQTSRLLTEHRDELDALEEALLGAEALDRAELRALLSTSRSPK